MAVTNKIVITGTSGGEAGLTNVGTNANVTWPTSGNPTYATTGLLQQGTDGGGMSIVNIPTAANRGTLTPWSLSDPKPTNMTGPGFLRMPAAHTGVAFTLLSDAIAATLNSTLTDGAGQAELDFEAGYLFTCWFRIYTDPTLIKHTAEPTITPAHNPGVQAIHDVQNGVGSSLGQFRTNFYNLAAFRPSAVISNGGYVSQGEDVLAVSGGGSSSLPIGHLNVGEWYPFQVWIRRSTGAAATDGEIRWYIGGALAMRTTGQTVWLTNAWRLQAWAGMLSGYAAARTGIQFDFGCPMKVQVVPEADLPSAVITNWNRNSELSLDLRRHWPVQCPVHPVKVTSVSGSPTAPTFGRLLNISGVNPGLFELPLAGAANAEQMVEFPAVWDGVSASPFGSAGWTYVSLDTCNPQGSRVAWRVRNAADNANLVEVVLDDSGTGTFSINGVQVLSGRTALPAHTRWQPVIAIHQSGGLARVALAELTDPSMTVRMLQWFDATTTYAGGAIGKPQASVRNVSGATGRVGACSVFAENSWVVGNSYSSAAMAANTYAISGVNQGTKTFTVATMQSGTARSRKPVAGDQVYVTGSTGNDGWYTVASATDTTIVVVEAIPSATANGSVDITAPALQCNANRLMQCIPARDSGSAIAPHYLGQHPLLANDFRGFHCLFNLARSGEPLSDIVSLVLPQCALSPPPKVLMMCFVVNDTTNATTVAGMVAQAKAVADNMEVLADFVAAHEGLLVHTAAINGENAGAVLNGWAARFRRVTPAQAYEIFRDRVRAKHSLDGHVAFVDPSKFLASGVIRLTGDGLHPDASTALDYVTGIHVGYEALRTLPGFNTGGSLVVRAGNRGRTGSVITAVGAGI